MIKVLKKLGREETCLNIIKIIYVKTVAKTILHGGQAESMSIKSWLKRGDASLYSIRAWSLNPSNKAREKKKKTRTQIEKEEIKLSLFADNVFIDLIYPNTPKGKSSVWWTSLIK